MFRYYLCLIVSFSYILSENIPSGFEVKPIPGKINSPYQDFGPNLNLEGDTLYFYSKRNGKDTDIFISKRDENGEWSDPKPWVEMNSPYDDQSPFLDEKNQMFYFSSNRDGAIEVDLPGNKKGVSRDIYVSLFDGKKWRKPEPLPPPVNTDQIEENPHFSDGYLYFTRYPFGKSIEAKIYRSRMHNGGWTKPELLPYPINDEFTTIAAFVQEGSDSIIFSSNRKGGFGGYDLYRTNLSDPSKGFENLGSVINTELDEAYFTLNKKNQYFIFCRRHKETGYDIMMFYPPKNIAEKLEEDGKISLNSILFKRGSSELELESYSSIDPIIEYLKKKKDKKIKITGHTDKVGSDELNKKLSLDRADSVKRYLIQKGISKDRITSEGKGSTEALIDSIDEESSRVNRRTEFELLD
jgi:hypothetical protein